MASSDFGRMLSVGAIRFEDRFCACKKGGEEEVGGFFSSALTKLFLLSFQGCALNIYEANRMRHVQPTFHQTKPGRPD